jgi:hypothetical protein
VAVEVIKILLLLKTIEEVVVAAAAAALVLVNVNLSAAMCVERSLGL